MRATKARVLAADGFLPSWGTTRRQALFPSSCQGQERGAQTGTHGRYSLGTTVPSAGGPVGAAGMCTGAPGSAGWLPIRVTFRWLSASSGCSSTFCRQVLGSVCTGPTAVTPPSPRSPRGSLQPRRHTLCCGHQLPIGPRGQLPQPVQRLRVPAPRSSGIAHGFSSPGHFGVFRSAWQGRAASLCVPGTRPGTAGS